MGERSSVIIVDDDATVLNTIKRGLSLEGYYCETAASATSALELLNKSLFDIMITDIGMPDMDGLELTKMAKRLKPDMIVIIMTGFIDKSYYDQSIEAGATDFIEKPFTLEKLISRMRHVIMQNKIE
jgi:DNA-binding NtrC family response regulator